MKMWMFLQFWLEGGDFTDLQVYPFKWRSIYKEIFNYYFGGIPELIKTQKKKSKKK